VNSSGQSNPAVRTNPPAPVDAGSFPGGRPPLTMRCYSAALHAFPWVRSGLSRLSFNFITNPRFAECGETITARLLNGAKIDVPPNDYHGRILYLFGTNDPKVQLTVSALLRPGDVFLDIGANYASIGLLAASRVGPEGRVHLFEPQESICRAVDEAISRARLTNVVLHRVALLDRDDRMTISRPRHHSGMATLVDTGRNQSDWETKEVPVKNVATYVEPLVRGVPFGAKVDVEGAEPAILPWLIGRPNLRFLVFEGAENRELLWEMLQEAGLTLFGLCRNVFVHRLRPVRSVSAMSAHHDLVAVRLTDAPNATGDVSPKFLARAMERASRGIGGPGSGDA